MRIGTALALGGACASLFGASYLAADLTGEEEEPANRAAPATAPAPAAQGRALALEQAIGLPDLRKPPKPPRVTWPEPESDELPADAWLDEESLL